MTKCMRMFIATLLSEKLQTTLMPITREMSHPYWEDRAVVKGQSCKNNNIPLVFLKE